MPECESCGNSLEPRDKNASGWWRDECLACIGERTPDADERGLDWSAYHEWLEGSE